MRLQERVGPRRVVSDQWRYRLIAIINEAEKRSLVISAIGYLLHVENNIGNLCFQGDIDPRKRLPEGRGPRFIPLAGFPTVQTEEIVIRGGIQPFQRDRDGRGAGPKQIDLDEVCVA